MEPSIVIRSAEFVKSAVKPAHYPSLLPEVAFAGRSNVGKSSLINCLLQRKKLVRTSRSPGQTQMINFFIINGAFYFVDLPGYGYAKVPERIRSTWGPMMETYLTQRESLRGIVQILDARHPPTPDDLQLWNWLQEQDIPTIPVLTKTDKMNRNHWKQLRERAALSLGTAPERIILFSAVTQEGRNTLLKLIAEWVEVPPMEEPEAD
jgi:GTP-binding protein